MLIAGVLLFAVGATATLTPADLKTTPSSELQKIEAFLGRGRNCIYNDVLYSDGQTIEVYQESCSKLVCRVIPGILNIGSTNHIYLQDLDNCKCSIITPRLPFPVVTVRKVVGTPEKLVSKNFVNLAKLLDLDLKLGCYFNNSFVFANNYVEHLPSKCSLLQCNMDDGRPRMEMFVKSICFCGANATTSSTSANTSTTSPTTTASSISTTSSASPTTMTSPTTTISPVGPTTTTSSVGPTTTTSPVGPSTTTLSVGPSTTTSSAGPTTTTSSAGPTTTTSPVGPTTTTSSVGPTTTTLSAGPTSPSSFSDRLGVADVDVSCGAYVSVSARHSMCLPPNLRCSVLASGVPAAAREAIVATHNSYRSRVARGAESRGLLGPQPMAANLFQLSWNEELARIAQAWAFQCQLSSECYECRAPVTRPYTFTGQNVHQLPGAPTRRATDKLSQVKEWEAVIESWYSEVVYVDESLVRSYAPVSHNKTVGHYTQMLWASTYEIGCGQVTFSPCMELVNNAPAFLEKCQLFVCNYGPARNQIMQPVYIIGPAGTLCKYGTSPKYNELCITPPESTN